MLFPQSCSTSVWHGPGRSGRAAQRRRPSLKVRASAEAQQRRSRSLTAPLFPDTGPPDHESSLELIKLDISRTFPHLCIFQQVGELHTCACSRSACGCGRLSPPGFCVCVCVSPGRALPRCAAQPSGSVHVLPARRWLRKSGTHARGTCRQRPAGALSSRRSASQRAEAVMEETPHAAWPEGAWPAAAAAAAVINCALKGCG